jgi:hypothetical protein
VLAAHAGPRPTHTAQRGRWSRPTIVRPAIVPRWLAGYKSLGVAVRVPTLNRRRRPQETPPPPVEAGVLGRRRQASEVDPRARRCSFAPPLLLLRAHRPPVAPACAVRRPWLAFSPWRRGAPAWRGYRCRAGCRAGLQAPQPEALAAGARLLASYGR